MHALLGLIVIAGFFLAVVASLWLLVRAFSESILWGLGCLFIAPVWLFFVIVHWRQAKDPFLLWLTGLGLVLGAAMMGGALPGFLR